MGAVAATGAREVVRGRPGGVRGRLGLRAGGGVAGPDRGGGVGGAGLACGGGADAAAGAAVPGAAGAAGAVDPAAAGDPSRGLVAVAGRAERVPGPEPVPARRSRWGGDRLRQGAARGV